MPGDPGERRHRERRQPAAEEQDRRHGAHAGDRHVLSQLQHHVGRGAVLDHVAGDKLRFRLDQVERGPVGLRQRRDEEDHEHRQQPQPIPAEEAPRRILRLDDGREIERADQEQHGDDDEADRDLVGDHLRRRAQRGQERIFRIRRPAGHDDAVDAERGDGEDVEHADVDVGDDPAGVDGNDRPGGERQRAGDQRRQEKHALVGAGGDDRLLEHELDEIGERLEQSPRADHVRPAPDLDGGPDLAVGIDDVGDGNQQDDEQQHALRHDDGERPDVVVQERFHPVLKGPPRRPRGVRPAPNTLPSPPSSARSDW